MMYKYLFGPVPSRRLGMSLGVDLIPHKICTFNCVYCECGKTTELTTQRKEYVPVDDVLKELEHFFQNNPDPDYITFSGAGEPTLNVRIGEVVDFIKSRRPKIPLALLTNGSLFFNKQVRNEVMKVDLVLPSLDAATEKTFRKLDRPAKNIHVEDYIQGLVEFREEFKGKIWLEVFILPGYNDDEENIQQLKQAITKIKPGSIQLNTLDRPGTISGLRPANKAELQNIINNWGFKNAEVIAAAPKRKDIKSYRKDTEHAIKETIARRPCTLEDLSSILGIHINEVNKYLGVLEEEGKIETKNEERGVFYKLKTN